MFKNIRADLRAYEGNFGAQGFWVMFVYRFGRWRYTLKPRILRKCGSFIYHVLFKIVQILTGIELPCEVTVGRNFVIDHFGGIIISGYAKFGDNCRIRDGVVIGLRRVEEKFAPEIGNDVDIGSGAKLLGPIKIGNNVRIGANAVVLCDVPDNCIAVGVPAVIKPSGNANTAPTLDSRAMTFVAIAIGRNEGERLKRCLASLSGAEQVVYVDSGSKDDSIEVARTSGVDVVELDMRQPFTAARARNVGFRRMLKLVKGFEYVQFLDGDCELRQAWPGEAIAFLESHADVGAVCGRRRERFPEKSIYNWLCDKEWDGNSGEVRACGGDVMIRATAFEGVHGFRDDLIAGEEPELCIRMRAAGWRVWRLKCEMSLHDAAILRFSQWWRRTLRGGYAFAQGAYLHGAPPERHFVRESWRAGIWGLFFPALGVLAGFVFGPLGLLFWTIYPFQILRQILRGNGHLKDRAVIATFYLLARFPEAIGQLKFLRDMLFRRQTVLVEYK